MTWNKVVTLRVFAAFAALAATGAQAATDPPIRAGSYYEENGLENCSGSNGCRLEFSPLPAGEMLTITRVTCFIRTKDTPLIQVSLAVRKSATQLVRSQFLVPTLVDSQPGEFVYAVNAEASYPVAATPVVQAIIRVARDASRIGLACQISGQLSS
jgi:hypothetical protein